MATRVTQLLQRARTLRGAGDRFISQDFAREFAALYAQLATADQRRDVLRTLGREFGVRPAALRDAAQLLQRADATQPLTVGDARMPALVDQWARAARPAHAALLATLAQLPEGMGLVLRLRSDAVRLRGQGDADADGALRALDHALRRQLQDWFALGFLQLRRVRWDETPAEVLEKIIEYEAVHSIHDWAALKQRLVGPRRCFAFFHPSLPREPLVFVEVALLDAIASSVQAILDEPVPSSTAEVAPPPTTAVFYGITATQPGLAGVELGNYLIKEVVRTLQVEQPSLSTFVTLSPMPGFAAWLRALLVRIDANVSAAERDLLRAMNDTPRWHDDASLAASLRPLLLRLGAQYLVNEKQRAMALDPVANFHLRNGAWLWRLNWLADISAKGLAQSHGLMVNYRYVLDDLATNHQRYLERGTIAVADDVHGLLG